MNIILCYQNIKYHFFFLNRTKKGVFAGYRFEHPGEGIKQHHISIFPDGNIHETLEGLGYKVHFFSDYITVKRENTQTGKFDEIRKLDGDNRYRDLFSLGFTSFIPLQILKDNSSSSQIINSTHKLIITNYHLNFVPYLFILNILV